LLLASSHKTTYSLIFSDLDNLIATRLTETVLVDIIASTLQVKPKQNLLFRRALGLMAPLQTKLIHPSLLIRLHWNKHWEILPSP